MSDEVNHPRRRLFGTAAMTLAAAQLGLIPFTHAQSGEATSGHVPAIKPGTRTSFDSLKQVDAGVLNVGYAEAGPAKGPVVIPLHGWRYDQDARQAPSFRAGKDSADSEAVVNVNSSETPGKQVRAKPGLNKSILDQGWFEFRRQLAYKLWWSGGELILVPPQNTSRRCPECEYVSAQNRQTQERFACIACGFEENADRVGAINVLRAGHARCACEVSDV